MKPDSSKVHPAVAWEAINQLDSRQSVYSRCIQLWWRKTGKLDTGFSNFDLQKWIDEYCPGMFDAKGKKL